MIRKSTIQLLRFPFSYFLMPVFWFALSFANNIDVGKAILVFVILHLVVYPSSNGYNSYMDRDETSIGGIEHPMQPTQQLFVVTVLMDVAAVILSLFVSVTFAIGVVFYILCSRMYSYRGIRLKKYPIGGYITVIANQGALIFIIILLGVQPSLQLADISWLGVVSAAFLIGGFYPITQVYQHQSDAKDGVTTISMLLGKRGTFVFCGMMYAIAFALLFLHYQMGGTLQLFYYLQLFFLPVIIYFLVWAIQVWKDESKASFKKTMRMNWIASSCTSFAFLIIILLKSGG